MFDPRTDVVFDPSGKNRLVYQAWFDSGGIVTNVFFLLLGSIFSFAVSQLMPAKALFKRYVLALTADSQHTLNERWAQPEHALLACGHGRPVSRAQAMCDGPCIRR